jgi:hypothetical protein
MFEKHGVFLFHLQLQFKTCFAPVNSIRKFMLKIYTETLAGLHVTGLLVLSHFNSIYKVSTNFHKTP